LLAKIFLFLSILSLGDSIFAQSSDETTINEAVKDGNIERVRVLSKIKTNLNSEDIRLMTPLLIACNDNSVEIVKILLESGADINRKHRENGRTALIYASANGYVDLIRILITKSGILLNAKDRDGKTALMHSVFNARKEAVSLLIEAGANVNSRSNSEDSALSLAVKSGRPEIVAILKQAGARE
jgi:ankyrin repeat protein